MMEIMGQDQGKGGDRLEEKLIHSPYTQKINNNWYLKCNCGIERKIVNKTTADKAKHAHWILSFIDPDSVGKE